MISETIQVNLFRQILVGTERAVHACTQQLITLIACDWLERSLNSTHLKNIIQLIKYYFGMHDALTDQKKIFRLPQKATTANFMHIAIFRWRGTHSSFVIAVRRVCIRRRKQWAKYTKCITMCPPGCHHNGFIATSELVHRMYDYTLWERIGLWNHQSAQTASSC